MYPLGGAMSLTSPAQSLVVQQDVASGRHWIHFLPSRESITALSLQGPPSLFGASQCSGKLTRSLCTRKSVGPFVRPQVTEGRTRCGLAVNWAPAATILPGLVGACLRWCPARTVVEGLPGPLTVGGVTVSVRLTSRSWWEHIRIPWSTEWETQQRAVVGTQELRGRSKQDGQTG